MGVPAFGTGPYPPLIPWTPHAVELREHCAPCCSPAGSFQPSLAHLLHRLNRCSSYLILFMHFFWGGGKGSISPRMKMQSARVNRLTRPSTHCHPAGGALALCADSVYFQCVGIERTHIGPCAGVFQFLNRQRAPNDSFFYYFETAFTMAWS